MHELLLTEIVKTVKQRYSEGDCPTIPRPSGETLEDAVLDLASRVEKEEEHANFYIKECHRKDAELAKLRGIMREDIRSALDDCIELGATAEEMRDVVGGIITKMLQA